MRLEYVKCYFKKYNYYNNICTLIDDGNSDFNIKNLQSCFYYLKANDNFKSNTYFFDIHFFIFDNLTEKGNQYLDNVLKKDNMGYLDGRYWKDYISSRMEKGLPEKRYKMEITERKMFEDYYKKLNEIYQTKKIDSELLKILRSNTKNKPILSIKKQCATLDTETALIEAFLDLVLLNGYNLRIKKCKNCKKYYLTTNKSKIDYCDREYFDTGYTCFTYYKSLKDDWIKELERKINGKLRRCGSREFPTFSKEYRKKLKLECNNDVSKYVSTLLDTYYVTITGKRKVIKKVHLAQYLNKEYLEKIGYEEYLNEVGYEENE